MKNEPLAGPLFICLFLMSLQSYFFYNISLAPFPVLSVICLAFILVIAVRKYQITSAQQVFYFIVFYIYLFLHALYSIFFNGDISPLFSVTISFFTFFAFLFLLNAKGERAFVKPINIVLIIHLMFWYLQFAVWLYSGSYLDFLEPITGESQRYLSLKGLTFGGSRMPRFTGLYSEPGTYSTYVFLLLVVQYKLTGGKVGVTEVLAVASMFLSMSLFGVVLSVLYGVVVILFNPKLLLKYKVMMASLILLIGVIIYPDINRRLDSSYSGVDDRYDFLFQMLERSEFLFGGQYIGDFAVNDLGVFVYLLTVYGFVAVILFSVLIASLFSRRASLGSYILFLAVLATKIKLTYPLFWFFLAIYVHDQYKKIGNRGK